MVPPLRDLLVELRRRGVRLASDGHSLRWSPVAALTPEMVRVLKAHEAELVEHVARAARERRQRQAFARARDEGWQRAGILRPPPQSGCHACDNRRFLWLEGGSQWICARCHPPVAAAHVAAEYEAPWPSTWAARRAEAVRRQGVDHA